MRRHQALRVMLTAIILLDNCVLNAGPPAPTAAPESSNGSATQETIVVPAAGTVPTGPTVARVTITFGAFEDWRPAYAPLIMAFEKDNPEIHVQFVPLDPIFRTGDPPDRE